MFKILLAVSVGSNCIVFTGVITPSCIDRITTLYYASMYMKYITLYLAQIEKFCLLTLVVIPKSST